MTDITVSTFIGKGGEITKRDFYQKFEEVTHCDGNFLDKDWEWATGFNVISKISFVVLTALTLAFVIAGAVYGGNSSFPQIAGVFGAMNLAALIATVIIHIKAKDFGDQKISENDIREELARFKMLTEKDGNKESFKAVGRRINLDY